MHTRSRPQAKKDWAKLPEATVFLNQQDLPEQADELRSALAKYDRQQTRQTTMNDSIDSCYPDPGGL